MTVLSPEAVFFRFLHQLISNEFSQWEARDYRVRGKARFSSSSLSCHDSISGTGCILPPHSSSCHLVRLGMVPLSPPPPQVTLPLKIPLPSSSSKLQWLPGVADLWVPLPSPLTFLDPLLHMELIPYVKFPPISTKKASLRETIIALYLNNPSYLPNLHKPLYWWNRFNEFSVITHRVCAMLSTRWPRF